MRRLIGIGTSAVVVLVLLLEARPAQSADLEFDLLRTTVRSGGNVGVNLVVRRRVGRTEATFDVPGIGSVTRVTEGTDLTPLDLYVAVLTPDGLTLFFTLDDPGLSLRSEPLFRSLVPSDAVLGLYAADIPRDARLGTYVFLAGYVRPGGAPVARDVVGTVAHATLTVIPR